jgi:hypothetical protein
MTMRLRTASLTACLILVVAPVTACSSASKPAAAGAGSGPAATSAAPAGASAPAGSSSTPSSGGGTTKDVDVCSVLTLADVARITGTTFTSTKADNTAGVIFGCDYDASGTDLQISVSPQQGKIGFDADVSALTGAGFAPTKVSGVGDEAWSEPDPKGGGSAGAAAFGSYGALFGQTYIKIGGLTYVNPDQGKQIVEQIQSKL